MKKNKKYIDPVFYSKFGIETPIKYYGNVVIDTESESLFHKYWKNAKHKKNKSLSKTRVSQFKAFFKRLEREGNDLKYCRRVSIQFINKTVGFGVFAKEDIPPYSTLGHYAGSLKHDDSVNPKNDSTFAFSAIRKYSIDAMTQGNWTRFMNHGEEEKNRVNVIPWEFYTDHGPRIVFTTGAHGVRKGDQLLYSYGDSYWDEIENRKYVSL